MKRATAPQQEDVRGDEPDGENEDHDGHTVLSSDLPAGPPEKAGTQASPEHVNKPVSAPIVLGRMCPQDHANPPTNSRCSICGSEMSSSPLEVRRPSLGRMRLSNGSVVELDRAVIVGRQPAPAG